MKEMEREQMSQDELKKIRRMSYIKMAAMVGVFVAVLAFGSIAWFTQSREVEGSGVQMKATYDGFDLQVSGNGSIGFSNLYASLENAIKGNSGTITNNETDGQFIRWRMENDDDKLSPGSEGVLNFKVISRGADISRLQYNLTIRAFVEETETTQQEVDGELVPVTTVTGIDEITSEHGTASQKLGANYLRGHILYFKSRTGTSGNYQYSGFIDNPSDFDLTLDSEGNAVIYWIWVNTFGQIALTSADTDYIQGNLPVLDAVGEANDRAAVTEYLSDNVGSIFDGNEAYSTLLETMYNKRKNQPAVKDAYRDEFERLSNGYNSADQTIGGYIDYALVELTAKPEE